MIHLPVLLNEIITIFSPQPNQRYIDCTIGGAGHATALISQGASVLGLDQDKAAIDYINANKSNPQLILVNSNFKHLAKVANDTGFTKVDGVLFDLDVSSLQLDTGSRGFSFNQEASLDMRMDTSAALTAAEIVNSYSKDDLYRILIENSQETKARAIAEAIVANRPLSSTSQLANLVAKIYGNRVAKIHPATKTFQAIRIEVNQELVILEQALTSAFSLLKPAGKLCVISFHEGEDRIVKRTFNKLIEARQALQLTKTPIRPSESEISHNPRARSAKLRVIKKGCHDRLQKENQSS